VGVVSYITAYGSYRSCVFELLDIDYFLLFWVIWLGLAGFLKGYIGTYFEILKLF